jgi:wyosine [tRNA(Phe)-imidazoG37] synthetase (radical SAM superfamily)
MQTRKSLHIETTTRCVLACPACPRTTWSQILKRPVSKLDLDVDLLEKFLDCELGKQFTHFNLCGDYGDPIYYPDLLKLINRFRDRISFNIVTNGSRQSEKFWQNLSDIMTENDSISFSIDGLENTNHLYRINSDWKSIMQGLDIMAKSPAHIHWKTIVFNFNFDKLNEIKNFAESKGATFHAEKTHRYGDASLVPPESYIESNHLFQEDFVNNQFEIEPRCETDAKVITADGYLSPCDWIRNPQTFYKSELWKQKARWMEKLKIKDNTYDQAILVVRDWENYVRQNSLTGSDKVEVLCKMLCRKGCVKNNRIELL